MVGPVTFPTFFLNDVENGTFQRLTASTKDRALFLLQIRPKGIRNTSFCKVETFGSLSCDTFDILGKNSRLSVDS